MDALFALIFANISKFLNYLNINPRLQNKIFTVVSIFPTLYILRIVRGYFRNQNYLRGSLYLGIFIVLTYFIILNFIYYFKDRKVKWDVTNFIEDIVPEDVTFSGDPTQQSAGIGTIKGKSLPLIFNEDSDLIIEEIIHDLVEKSELKPNELNSNTYWIDKYSLIPYYRIKKGSLLIGSNYQKLTEIAKIDLADGEHATLIPLGVFILGGPYQLDGITYKEPFSIELRVREEEDNINRTLPNQMNHEEKKLMMKRLILIKNKL
ncbi:DUF6681 family protein [Vagococcus sp.]|uniref:DUF6681 family protein n=1 Tax=Vagococcus sp. TaxID=1933889 RepID=UPI003F9C68BB